MAEADTCRLPQPPGMNISERSSIYAVTICLRSVLGRIYTGIESAWICSASYGGSYVSIPLIWSPGFFNPSNFTQCVVGEGGAGFWRRNLSGSFNENEELDFEFATEAPLRTSGVLGQSRGVECTAASWLMTKFRVFLYVVALMVSGWTEEKPGTQNPFIHHDWRISSSVSSGDESTRVTLSG